MSHKPLNDRRTITSISYECRRGGDVTVTFADASIRHVPACEANELFVASGRVNSLQRVRRRGLTN